MSLLILLNNTMNCVPRLTSVGTWRVGKMGYRVHRMEFLAHSKWIPSQKIFLITDAGEPIPSQLWKHAFGCTSEIVHILQSHNVKYWSCNVAHEFLEKYLSIVFQT